MTSSNYSESHEPESEFQSPFLDETFFTDEAAARASQAWESRQSTFNKVESPFLDESELWQERLSEPKDDDELLSDDLEEAFDEELEIEGFLAPAPTSSKSITPTPQPNHLYRIKKGDTLLKIAEMAYTEKAGSRRLRRAQLINRHPFNWRYHVPGKQRFTKQYFPEGIISFYPRVTCVDASLDAPLNLPPSGKCYPLALIPPRDDIWFRPPPEVVQPDSWTCWAAAVLSWSWATLGSKKFKSIDDVVESMRKLELEVNVAGTIKKWRIVNRVGGLVRWPKRAVVFKQNTGGTKTVSAGQLTFELIAAELGLNLVVKDSNLTIEQVHSILESSQDSVIVLKFTQGEIGHASVIFGMSKSDGFLGEMDPFPNPKRHTGPVLGKQKARWLPTFKTFKNHANDDDGQPWEPWEEFAFLFKKKGTTSLLTPETYEDDQISEPSADETALDEFWNENDTDLESEVAWERPHKFNEEPDFGSEAEAASEEEEWEDEALKPEFISDEFTKSEMLDDEFLDNETLDDEFLDNEFSGNNSENNFVDDEALDDEFLDDKDLESELEYEVFDDKSVLFDQEVNVATQPTPGRFYQIRSGDNLLKIAGIAYEIGSGSRRLAFAKYINGHPLNHRYYVKSHKDFDKKQFSGGIISFLPKFSCDVDELLNSYSQPSSGKCLAVIWIPHNRVSYHSFLGKGRKRAFLETEVENELSKHQARTRIKVPSYLIKEVPFRWTCLLELAYQDPDDTQSLLYFYATGFLIDKNYILTAAHCLFTVIQGSKGTPKPMQVSSIRIAPGVNGWQSKDYLFGIYEIKNADGYVIVPSQWLRRNKRYQSLDIPPSSKRAFHKASDRETNRFDYGLIKLDKDIGASLFKKINNEPLGHWGDRETSKIKPFNPKISIKGDVHIFGYAEWRVRPRQGYIQFKASTGVTSIDVGSRALINYSETNTEGGMSGGPIVIEYKGNQQLIGVHGHEGYGLLLTSEVLRDVEQMKRQLS